MSNTFKDKRHLLILVTSYSAMQRATVVQLHYVVDHPIVGEQLI